MYIDGCIRTIRLQAMEVLSFCNSLSSCISNSSNCHLPSGSVDLRTQWHYPLDSSNYKRRIRFSLLILEHF